MEVKNRKLQNQFENEASTGVSDSEKLIFQGVSIFVDGFTIPSHQVLPLFLWFILISPLSVTSIFILMKKL